MQLDDFMELFKNAQFEKALQSFQALSQDDQLHMLEGLYQAAAFQRKPAMISVLKRTLKKDCDFDDFYRHWFPPKEGCDRIERFGEVYHQSFPLPVRVVNGSNIDDSNEIISVGITWMRSDAEMKQAMEYINNAQIGKDKQNEQRHDRIAEVAEGGLIGIYQVKTDDNLGTMY